MKVGSDGARNMNASVASRWQSLSAEQKESYQQEASRMQQARNHLISQPLRGREEQHESLRPSQIHRLNNARLDNSLRQVARHPAWKAGLQLRDHVSALKPEHVLGDLDEKTISSMYQDIFAYDATVETNQDLPRYETPCVSIGGGICRNHEHFTFVDGLVRTLDAAAAAAKLRQSTALLSIQNAGVGKQWMIVGCVGLRPLVQTILCLHPVSPQLLTINVDCNARPKITTTHRLLFSIVQKHVQDGHSLDAFCAEAGSFLAVVGFWNCRAPCRVTLIICLS